MNNDTPADAIKAATETLRHHGVVMHPDDITGLVQDVAAALRTTSLAAQDGLVEALGKMWGTLTYIRAASDCDASRNAADEVMREVEPALSAIKGDK